MGTKNQSRLTLQQKQRQRQSVKSADEKKSAQTAGSTNKTHPPPRIANPDQTAQLLIMTKAIQDFATLIAAYNLPCYIGQSNDSISTKVPAHLYLILLVLYDVYQCHIKNQHQDHIYTVAAIFLISGFYKNLPDDWGFSSNLINNFGVFLLSCTQIVMNLSGKVATDTFRRTKEIKELGFAGINTTEEAAKALTAKLCERAYLEAHAPTALNYASHAGIGYTIVFFIKAYITNDPKHLHFINTINVSNLLIQVALKHWCQFREKNSYLSADAAFSSSQQVELFIKDCNKALTKYQLKLTKLPAENFRQTEWESRVVDNEAEIYAFIAKQHKEPKSIEESMAIPAFYLQIPIDGAHINNVLLSAESIIDAIHEASTQSKAFSIYHVETPQKSKNFITLLCDLHASQNLNPNFCHYYVQLLEASLENASKLEAALQKKEREYSSKAGEFCFTIYEQHEVHIAEDAPNETPGALDAYAQNTQLSVESRAPDQSTKKLKKNTTKASDTQQTSNKKNEVRPEKSSMLREHNTRASRTPQKAATMSANASLTHTWQNLFAGKGIDRADTLTDCIIRSNLCDSSVYTQPFLCWNPELDRESGLETLKKAFQSAGEKQEAKEHIALLKGGVRYGQRNHKVYEVRRAKCNMRVLGINVSNPGEVPFIFFTVACSHQGINHSKILAVKRALERAPDVTSDFFITPKRKIQSL